MLHTIRDNYSANVELALFVEGRTIPLAKIGPDFVVLAEPTELARGFAVVRMSVDGEFREWNVSIEGAVPFDDRIRICDAE